MSSNRTLQLDDVIMAFDSDENATNTNSSPSISSTLSSSSSSIITVSQNMTVPLEYPYNMTFNTHYVIIISAYCILFVIAAIGNLTVFASLFRNRHRKSRINMMIMHLAIADLIVTFVIIPLEIGWRISVRWIAGDIACKVLLFCRAFGLYLSSTVLVCVSLDRYFAILHPLKVNDAQRRGKIMLTIAWIVSIASSTPQSVIFSVRTHPDYPDYTQCVSFHFFPTPEHELAYNVFCMLGMYGGPLIIIVFVYAKILWKISKKSKETRDNIHKEELYRGRLQLRRSDMTNIARAKSRTLRMTFIIVMAFIWCWTPYFVMTMWYMFDRASASEVNIRVQDFLFMFAVSNSCVNPMVYGTYVINLKRECCTCFCRRRTVFNRRTTGSGETRCSREATLPSSIRISTTCVPNMVNIRVRTTTEGALLNQVVKCSYYGDLEAPSVENFEPQTEKLTNGSLPPLYPSSP